MSRKHSNGGFLETALGRAQHAETKSPAAVATITYTEEVDSGRTFAISPQVEAVFGYSQEEWMGDADLWIERIHPDDKDRVVDACERANRARETYRTEYRIIARDGQIVWVHDEAELVGGSAGPLCWQGVMRVLAHPPTAE